MITRNIPSYVSSVEDVAVRWHEDISCSSSWFGSTILKALVRTFLKTLFHVLTCVLVSVFEGEVLGTFIKDLILERQRHIHLNLSLYSLLCMPTL
jgi:hypothetical protein